MEKNTLLSGSTDSPTFPYYGELGTTNLDTLTAEKFGVYRQSDSGNLYSGLNYPVDSPGALLVMATSESGCTQEYRPYESNALFRRRYYKSTIMWTWSEWCQEYNSENPPSSVPIAVAAECLPVGAIILWTSGSLPDGWLICNGSSFNPDEYPVLGRVLRDCKLPLLKISGSIPVTYIIKSA